MNEPYEVLDERFARLPGDHRLEKLYDGCRWAEGPVYFAAGRYLLFSDIPNNRIMRWDECTGTVGVFRTPSNHANGHAVDRQGRLVSCEHSGRRVTRTEHDGSITVIADRYENKRFNSPNDVVVKSDGSIWFTDPSYGIASDYEGYKADSEIGGCHVYRVDPDTGTPRIVADDFVQPNGLAFSADERRLYISDSEVSHMRVFDVTPDNTLANGRVIARCEDGVFDGFRLDVEGRLWAGVGGGVHCYEPDGTLIGRIVVPEPAVANVVFGGARRNRLFMAATTAIYSFHLKTSGLALV